MITVSPIKTAPAEWPMRRVVDPIEVRLNGSFLCVIEAGYVSDGLSRPWWVFWKWGRWTAKYQAAALLHDHLLDTSPHPKWVIDWLFMGALRAAGVSALEAGIFWLGVRTRPPGKAFRA